MKIGVVCPYDLGAAGGVQQLTTELAARLVDGGDEAVLVGPGTVVAAAPVVGVGGTAAVPGNRSRVPITIDPRSVAATRKALHGCDVVHIHEPFMPLVGWAALGAGLPTVVTFHADPAPWTRILYRRLAGPARRFLRAAHLTAVSEVAASALPESWGRPEIIPNAIDLSAYRLDVERQPTRIAFLGRDDVRKGLDVLLAAWPAVRKAHGEAELIVIGAERPSLPPGVTALGRVDEAEKRRLLASSLVYVAPHLGGESFGIVVAEAMAAGCAVVASDIPAFGAVLGNAGTLVPPGDPVRLASEIAGFLSDPAAALATGRLARRQAGRFDWSRVVDRYRQAYESALARGGSRIGGRPNQ